MLDFDYFYSTDISIRIILISLSNGLNDLFRITMQFFVCKIFRFSRKKKKEKVCVDISLFHCSFG